jgi:hypothetical protein
VTFVEDWGSLSVRLYDCWRVACAAIGAHYSLIPSVRMGVLKTWHLLIKAPNKYSLKLIQLAKKLLPQFCYGCRLAACSLAFLCARTKNIQISNLWEPFTDY